MCNLRPSAQGFLPISLATHSRYYNIHDSHGYPQRWYDKAQKETKSSDPVKKLEWTSSEGLTLQPVYYDSNNPENAELPGIYPFKVQDFISPPLFSITHKIATFFLSFCGAHAIERSRSHHVHKSSMDRTSIRRVLNGRGIQHILSFYTGSRSNRTQRSI